MLINHHQPSLHGEKMSPKIHLTFFPEIPHTLGMIPRQSLRLQGGQAASSIVRETCETLRLNLGLLCLSRFSMVELGRTSLKWLYMAIMDQLKP
jgi:hypothetical protein